MSLTPAMASRIEMWPLERLIPYARNARTHSEAQVAQIAASMLEFGVNNPLLVDSQGGLVAGHGRLLATRKLGLEQLPVVVLDHLSDTQRRAYILADNRLAELAGWDTEMLALELSELEGEFDISVMGFDEEEVRKLLGDVAEDVAQENTGREDTDEDTVPEAPVQPVSSHGDIWLLGKHRLICGDSAKSETVSQLMGGEKAALCFSSPPYGNQRDYTQGIDDWDSLMRGVYGNIAEFMTSAGQVLVNLSLIHRDSEVMPYWDDWIAWMRGQGWRRFAWYVWHQGYGLPGDWHGRLAPAFEFIFHFNREPRKANKFVPCKFAGSLGHLDTAGSGTDIRNRDGSPGRWTHTGRPVQEYRIPDSVISIGRQAGPVGKDIDHPAVFPVGLPEHIMLSYSDENEIVYEPFSGSGSTMLAGERSNRQVRAAEIAPEYVDVAIIRFTRAYPDIPAILASTGQTFEEVRHERQPDN
jgi:DNA modification methylase